MYTVDLGMFTHLKMGLHQNEIMTYCKLLDLRIWEKLIFKATLPELWYYLQLYSFLQCWQRNHPIPLHYRLCCSCTFSKRSQRRGVSVEQHSEIKIKKISRSMSCHVPYFATTVCSRVSLSYPYMLTSSSTYVPYQRQPGLQQCKNNACSSRIVNASRNT